jgi:NADH:ubiquinone oxidoreductase subunit C
MFVEAILQVLREVFPTETIEVQAVPINESFIALPPNCIHHAMEVLVDRFDLRHLSTITGQDTGSAIELLYHFWDGGGLTLRTSLPRNEPHIATLTDLIPGAALYEREVCEMLGVTFDGHPDPRPLLLPDNWDKKQFPMKIDYQNNRLPDQETD